MLSRPKLGVNTAVYGQIPFEEAIQNVQALEVDGFVAQLTPATSLEALAGGVPLPLWGIELETYSFGQLPVNVEDIVQISQSLGCDRILLPPVHQREEPTVQQAIQFVEDVQRLADTAVDHNQTIVVTLTNRYESALLNNFAQAETFIEQVNRPNVHIQASTYNLHIEEQDGAGQLHRLGERLAFLKMADSNHGPIGSGNIKMGAYLWALQEMPHEVPILLDAKRPSPSPFTPQQEEIPVQELLKRSRIWF